jgi:hypothetical protein
MRRYAGARKAPRRGGARTGVRVSLRPLTRAALLTSTLALAALSLSAQAASAWILSSVSPKEGCAGTVVTFTGTLFGPVGTPAQVLWSNPASQGQSPLIITTAKTTVASQFPGEFAVA